MKKQLLLLLFGGIVLFAYSQDTIYFKSGEKAIALVLEISANQIKYRSWPENNGPVYVVLTENILKIVNTKGAPLKLPTPLFVPPSPLPGRQKKHPDDPISKDFGRNLISFNISDLFFDQITFFYERTLKNGQFVLRFPVSIGMLALKIADTLPFPRYRGYYNANKMYSLGFDFYVFPSKQGSVRGFIGPSLEYGQVLNSYSYSNIYYPSTTIAEDHYYSSFYSIILQSGALFQLTKNFNISFNTGVGYVRIKNKMTQNNYWQNRGDIAIRGGLAAGIKF